jgi:hypothetical protein
MKSGTAVNLAIAGAIGVGVYLLYEALTKTGQALSCAASQAGQALSCGICRAESAIANLIWKPGAQMGLNGNVVLPNGNQVALQNLPVSQDCAGNVYVQYLNGTYQLSPSNSCGNWPATQVA